MSSRLLLLVAMIYLWVALGYAGEGRWGLALAWAAYAIANLGFAIEG